MEKDQQVRIDELTSQNEKLRATVEQQQAKIDDQALVDNDHRSRIEELSAENNGLRATVEQQQANIDEQEELMQMTMEQNSDLQA